MEAEHIMSSATMYPQGKEQMMGRTNKDQKPRARVSVACQRCKHRKQKCNGEQPTCARCLKFKFDCHYATPIHPNAGQAKLYMKALEDRVAELETLLMKGGDRSASRDHWGERSEGAEDTEGEDIKPLLNAVRDLSLDVAGSYVGGASTITLGRALETALAGKMQFSMASTGSIESRSRRKESIVSELSSTPGMLSSPVSKIDGAIADKMVHAYLKHLYANFPIIYSYDVLDLHHRRQSLTDVYEESILSLIYGLGGHFLEKTGESIQPHNPESYYNQALDNREVILQLGDIRSLVYLLLLGQHCLRMPKDPGAWTFFGLAMKMCIELGLHRKRRSVKMSLQSELRKRLFWSCYAWDRELAIVMGRPPSISDHDIDIDLPLDVDEANKDVEALRKAIEDNTTVPKYPQTTMTCFIHLLRLKRLESEIQHKLYRVDNTKSIEAVYKTTDTFLEKLYQWKDAIPPQSNTCRSTDRYNFDGSEYRQYDSYMASYHKAIRVLVQPRLYENPPEKRYFDICVSACRGVCEVYKRLHDRIPLVFSSVSLQTVFLAGLTLIYCMWHDSSSADDFGNFGALSDCSIILYVMTERWPASRKYRDLFETVKKSVLDAISEGKHVPRATVISMRANVHASLQSLQATCINDNIPDDLEQMISDMTGESVSFWDNLPVMEVNNAAYSGLVVDTNAQLLNLGRGGWEVDGWEDVVQ